MLGRRYYVENVADLFRQAGRDLLNASNTSPRGEETREIISPQIIIKDPRQRLVYNKERKYNIIFALIESLMLYSPSDKVKHFSEFNKNMEKFSDDGLTLSGAYGTRISTELKYIIDKLTSDNHSRQAVVSIYRNDDIHSKSKGVPCTLDLQFLVRDNKLHMVVNMRSNDILYGFQHDVVMFTILQETIANTLQIPMGYYIHQPSSLHVYRNYYNFKGYDMLENMVNESSSIGFTNSSNLNQWHSLADAYTGKNNKFALRGTALDVLRMINVERAYRDLKADNKLATETGKQIMNDITVTVPKWITPFVSRWNIK